MDVVNSHENLSTLQEMLLDERKLVTYVSLSKEMCIHVNESKSLLQQIVQDLRKKHSEIELNVCYIISGLLDTNKACTTVCSEQELDGLKSKFKIVFYHHLYSVSVGSSTVDNVSFMAVNQFDDIPLYNGLIKSNSCVKRSADEIGSLKTNSQEVSVKDPKPSISVQRKVKEEIKNSTNIFSNSKQVLKNQEIKPVAPIKTEALSPKKETSQNNVLKTDKKNGNKAQKGIAGFFNKPAANPKPLENTSKDTKHNSLPKHLQQELKDIPKVKTEKMDVDEDTSVKEVTKKPKKEIAVEPQKESKETPKDAVSLKNKNKKLNQIKNNAKVDKKRKRVLHVSDSESDEEKNDPFAEEPVVEPDSDDEIPPTPLVNTVKITSGITNPKKRRKIVNKTYTDEDGYLLTKKEEVYESCSENEEEVHIKENVQNINKVKDELTLPEKKNGIDVSPPEKKPKTKDGIEVSPLEKKSTKNGKRKMASPQKGKQATLMSFFKKV